MNEFTPTVTIELEQYMIMKQSITDYEERLDGIRQYILNNDPELAEELRDDGFFDMI